MWKSEHCRADGHAKEYKGNKESHASQGAVVLDSIEDPACSVQLPRSVSDTTPLDLRLPEILLLVHLQTLEGSQIRSSVAASEKGT